MRRKTFFYLPGEVVQDGSWGVCGDFVRYFHELERSRPGPGPADTVPTCPEPARSRPADTRTAGAGPAV